MSAREEDPAHGQRHRLNAMSAHRSGRLLDANLWCTFRSDEFGPDQVPRFLAKSPAFQCALGGCFAAPSFYRTHVSAPCQALIQVLFVDAGQGSQSASLGSGDFSAHTPHLSESLVDVQAIRYVNTKGELSSGQLDNALVETSNERRLRKLKVLCAAHGLVQVAEKAGLKPVYLEQIIKGVLLPPKKGDGSRSERALGDSAARAIEGAYDLGRGWFDNDGEEAVMSPDEMLLVGFFRKLDPETQAVMVEHMQTAVEERAGLLARLRGKTPPVARPNPEQRVRPGANLSGRPALHRDAKK